MHRSLLSVGFSSLVVVWLAASPAFAQTTGVINVVVTSLGNRNSDQLVLNTNPINLQECQNDTPIDVTVSSVPLTMPDGSTAVSILDFWQGTGCNDTAPRMAYPSQQTCVPLTFSQATNNRTMFQFTFLPSDFLSSCTGNTGNTYDIFLLAAAQMQSTADVGTGYADWKISVDTSPPLAPENLTGSDGQNQLGVSWTASNDSLDQYLLLLDTSGTGCATEGGVTQDGGTPGADAGTGGSGVIGCHDAKDYAIPAGYVCAGTASSTASNGTIDPTSYNIALNHTVRIGVVAVDKAFNTSPVASVCVTRITTTGFCEAVGGCPNTCSCSVPGARDASGPASGLAALAAIALALVWRRRR